MVFALAGDSTMTRLLGNSASRLLPDEERPRKTAYLVRHLELREPRQQLRCRPAAALLDLLDARRGIRAQRPQDTIDLEDGPLDALEAEADLPSHVRGAPHEGRAVD